MDKKVSFEDILHVLGEFGRYQRLVYFLYCLPFCFSSMQLFSWVFTGAKMRHKCGENDAQNFTFSCDEPCESFEFDGSFAQDSVVKEWNLICDREGMRATTGAAQMVGYLFGGFFLGSLSDKIGRKPSFLISVLLMVVFGVLAALAPEYYSFTACRTVVGFSVAGIDSACFVLGMELVGKTKRTLAGLICWFFETGGLLSAVTVAYFINDNWRLLQFVTSFPAVIFVAYVWIAPESIRWLIQRGRNEEARMIIEKTARINGIDLPSGMIEAMEEESENENGEANPTILDLFRYFHMRVKTLALTVGWISCASLYFVLLLDQSELSDNPYTGFLITASVQIPGYLYVIFTLERPFFGRKRSLCAFLIISGVTLCVHPIIPSRYSGLKMGLSILGRFCANCSYTILHLFSAEQFPTTVRCAGMGYCYVVSRFGTILAPYFLLVGNLAPVIFGFFALIAGLLSLLLPETLGQDLPETLKEGENLKIIWPFNKKAALVQ